MSANVGNEYDSPREASSSSPRRIKRTHHAPSYHKGFMPLNGTIPEETEECYVDVERAYDVIKADLSVDAPYAVPKSEVCPESSESQFGVANPCYATASEEKAVNFYDVPKDSK